jgi:predicted nucleotidyltransferase
MQATSYSDINSVLDDLLSRIQSILGKKLIGFYLYGSLVSGDFDTGSSDIDLLAATSSDIDEEDFDTLQKMHGDFANEHEEWDDRIEVAYLSRCITDREITDQ